MQMEIQRRKNLGRSHNCCSPFSAKLKCGDCGEYFGSKVWHSNSKYKRTIWQCNAKFKGESKCATPHLYEQRIKELFLEAAGILMEVTAGLIQKLVDENATRNLDQHDYRKKYDGYVSRYAAFESRMDSLEKERERKEIQYDIFRGLLAGLSETGSCRWISMRSCSTGLWITQRFIRTAGWFSPSATEWKSRRRFKESSGRGIGLLPDASGLFLCRKIENSIYGNLRKIEI